MLDRVRRPRTALLCVLVVLLAVFDLVVISPGWPYLVVLGVPALAGWSLTVVDPQRRRATAVGAVLLSCAGTVALAIADYLYLGSWGFAETASLLLLVVAWWRRADGRADRLLAGGAAVAVVAQSLRVDLLDAPLHASLLALAVSVAVALGVTLRAADAQHRSAVAAVRRSEREEVARELHDVVAHHVTGMVVATQAARAVLAADPAQVPGSVAGALSSVEDAGTEALAAMRRMVGVLRTEPAADAQRLPTPRLTDLVDLVERFRATGASGQVELRVEGDTAPLPAEVQAGVYRVVQESLTNVQRHARGAALVEVRVVRAPAAVEISVVNTAGRGGSVAPPAGGGFGVLGMQERVTTLGGTLAAGPHDGGWAVDATVPAGPSAPRPGSDA